MDELLTSKIRGLDLSLKSEQEQAVKHLCAGKDALAVLPTGFGKSRIFQAYARLKSRENGVTLLTIAPLTSIIEDQLADIQQSFGLVICN